MTDSPTSTPGSVTFFKSADAEEAEPSTRFHTTLAASSLGSTRSQALVVRCDRPAAPQLVEGTSEPNRPVAGHPVASLSASDRGDEEGLCLLETLRAQRIYVHLLPGRLRLEASGFRRNPAALKRLQASLAAAPGVRKVDVSTTTARVLVSFNPAETTHAAVACRLESLGAFGTLAQALHKPAKVAEGSGLARKVATVAAQILVERAVEVAIAALL